MPKEECITVKARKALSKFWDEAKLRGRCWGRKKIPNNQYVGANITFATASELVSISKGPNGQLIIHEFTRIRGDGKGRGTGLGKRVKEKLREEGLPFQE